MQRMFFLLSLVTAVFIGTFQAQAQQSPVPQSQIDQVVKLAGVSAEDAQRFLQKEAAALLAQDEAEKNPSLFTNARSDFYTKAAALDLLGSVVLTRGKKLLVDTAGTPGTPFSPELKAEAVAWGSLLSKFVIRAGEVDNARVTLAQATTPLECTTDRPIPEAGATFVEAKLWVLDMQLDSFGCAIALSERTIAAMQKSVTSIEALEPFFDMSLKLELSGLITR